MPQEPAGDDRDPANVGGRFVLVVEGDVGFTLPARAQVIVNAEVVATVTLQAERMGGPNVREGQRIFETTDNPGLAVERVRAGGCSLRVET